MKTITRLILPLALLIPFVLGCDSIQRTLDEVSKPHDIVSDDGATQLTVPGLWTKSTPVNPQISLQVSYIPGDAHIAVIGEPRVGGLSDLSVDEYTELLQKDMPRRMTNLDVGAPASLEIGGLDARQFEMTGSIQGHDYKYIFTTVVDGRNFYQVFAWTTPARFQDNREEMIAGIATFKPVGGVPATPTPNGSKIQQRKK